MTTIPEIEISDAREHLDQGTAAFLDIRDSGSYALSHIPGALHVDDTSVDTFIASADKNQTLVVYCYHGNSSIGGAGYFLQNGFREVYSMRGGFESWRTDQPCEPGTKS